MNIKKLSLAVMPLVLVACGDDNDTHDNNTSEKLTIDVINLPVAMETASTIEAKFVLEQLPTEVLAVNATSPKEVKLTDISTCKTKLGINPPLVQATIGQPYSVQFTAPDEPCSHKILIEATGVASVEKPLVVEPNEFASLLKKPSDCQASHCPSGVYVVESGDAESLYNLGTRIGGSQDGHTAGMTSQWSNNRYGILIKPGEYKMPGPFKVNYYTEIAGVGTNNSVTKVSPAINALNDCDATQKPLKDTCKTVGGLNNFWRSVSNLTMDRANVKGPMRWAVSQASPMRNVTINGDILLCDWTTADGSCGFTSGGFMADITVSGQIIPGSQQQWLARNSNFNEWDGGLWNMVFLGVAGSNIKGPEIPKGHTTLPVTMAQGNVWDDYPLTVGLSTPVIAEKPYLVYDDSNASQPEWQVVIPAVYSDVSSITPTNQDTRVTIHNNNFYLVKPTDNTENGLTILSKEKIKIINDALAEGKHIIVMPGYYELQDTIVVPEHDGTRVMMGLGLPAFACMAGTPCLSITAEQGVRLGGIIFDAGYEKNNSLVQMGTTKNNNDNSANPIILNDIFCRIAETQLTERTPGKERQTRTCMEIYTNHVVGDNLWLWRGDHDKASGNNPDPAKNLVTWEQNQAQYGIIIHGDQVKFYGLAVEHFQNYQTVWLGEKGLLYFYQSEMPYNVLSLDKWTCSLPDGSYQGKNGCASYVVGPNVQNHNAYGISIYSDFASAALFAPGAVLAPQNNITMKNLTTRFLDGDKKNENSGIAHIVSDYNGSSWGPEVTYSDSTDGYTKNKEQTAAMGSYPSTANK